MINSFNIKIYVSSIKFIWNTNDSKEILGKKTENTKNSTLYRKKIRETGKHENGRPNQLLRA